MALHSLLKGINQDDQLRRVGQQLIQLAAALFARIGHTHGVASGLLQDWQHALDRPRSGPLTHAKQIGQHLVGWIAAQPDDGEQNLVAIGQIKRMAGARCPLAIRSVAALNVGHSQARLHVEQQLVKLMEIEAGQGLEDRRMQAQIGIAEDHGASQCRALFRPAGPWATSIPDVSVIVQLI